MSEPKLSESEVIEFVNTIESGDVVLTPEHEPQDVYAGDVVYIASNGWRIVIFNDANEWDYIDSVTSQDGRSFDFDQIEQMPILSKYHPADDVAWSCYRIPGYMKFRCVACGTNIKKPPWGIKEYRCSNCLEENAG